MSNMYHAYKGNWAECATHFNVNVNEKSEFFIFKHHSDPLLGGLKENVVKNQYDGEKVCQKMCVWSKNKFIKFSPYPSFISICHTHLIKADHDITKPWNWNSYHEFMQ